MALLIELMLCKVMFADHIFSSEQQTERHPADGLESYIKQPKCSVVTVGFPSCREVALTLTRWRAASGAGLPRAMRAALSLLMASHKPSDPMIMRPEERSTETEQRFRTEFRALSSPCTLK